MKIAAGLVAVLMVLLGMIVAVGHIDGSFSADVPPGTEVEAPGDSQMTGVEKGFLEFVINTLQAVSSDIHTLGSLFSQPEMEDQYWCASVTMLLNRIEAGYPSIAPLQPSDRLKPFHDSALNALDHSARFARLMHEELDAGRTSLTDETATELLAAAEAFGQAEATLQAFLDAHPVAE